MRRITILFLLVVVLPGSFAACRAGGERRSIEPTLDRADVAGRPAASPGWARVEDLRACFDAADARLHGGDGYKNDTNDDAALAWRESYIMMAYAAMYEATGDAVYLLKLADHADAVLASRDDHRGVVDGRGRSQAAWQSRRYLDSGEPHCFVVHSGMITYPMAVFAALVGADPELSRLSTFDASTLGARAAEYTVRVAETLLAHEGQWVSGPGEGEGFYRFSPDIGPPVVPGSNLPWNQQNAMGRTLIAMYVATGDERYRDRAARLARLFRRFLARSGDAYVWQTANAFDDRAFSGCGEDLSHAAINVDFASLACREGIVFTPDDMSRFAATFRDKVIDPGGRVMSTVNGCPPPCPDPTTIGRWLALSAWDDGTMVARVLAIYEPLLDGRSRLRPTQLLGLARLAQAVSREE